MSFREVRFDLRIAYGYSSGPSYKTSITELPNGDEFRRSWWSKGRKKWRLKKEGMARTEVKSVENFFRAMKGKAYGFRLRDWNSYLVVDEPVGILTNTTAQLQFRYLEPITSTVEIQKVSKPVLVTDVNADINDIYYSPDITLKRNGTPWPSSGNWSLDRTTGVLTYTVSQAGQAITWSGSYDWKVRFDTDEMMVTRESTDDHEWSDIAIIELKQ